MWLINTHLCRFFFYLFLLFIFSHYTIVASNQIRPNADYHVSVSLHDESQPCEIKISIQNENATYNNAKTVTVEPFTTKLVEFQVCKLKKIIINRQCQIENFICI